RPFNPGRASAASGRRRPRGLSNGAAREGRGRAEAVAVGKSKTDAIDKRLLLQPFRGEALPLDGLDYGLLVDGIPFRMHSPIFAQEQYLTVVESQVYPCNGLRFRQRWHVGHSQSREQ